MDLKICKWVVPFAFGLEWSQPRSSKSSIISIERNALPVSPKSPDKAQKTKRFPNNCANGTKTVD